MEDILLTRLWYRRLEEFGDTKLIRWVVIDDVRKLVRTDSPSFDKGLKAYVLPEYKNHAIGNQTDRQLVGSLVENELHHDVLIGRISFQTYVVSICLILADCDMLHGLGHRRRGEKVKG